MKYLIAVFITVISFGCKETGAQNSAVSENGDFAFGAEPKHVIEGVNQSVKVYDFEGLQKLLNRKDERTYVVNFWATWCKPCVAELPHFEEINDKYRDKNVEVVLVSLDFPAKADELLIPFLEKKHLKSKVLLLDDPKMNEWIPKVDNDWSGAIPATLIFNKNNRAFYEKSFTFMELENALKKAL
ncbi:TlpA disulfide reductase family protein [Robertkochia solimangrovi]|uniref:TlpA disulfide reductase family protein n=1 Tax=Robertkochia solimangrovi TaxID=2213046 RepID=UPI00117CBE97|nr:TlpA disulfide reductase family protein [Robertkochia solimangrovi]TRZ41477.1 TlpA family protein disulfide reductase [Robertkochia solimangrovi]